VTARARPLSLASLLLAACALAAAGAQATGRSWPLVAAPVLLAGAWPLLARATPGEPSALKLVLFSGLLSPVWLAVLLYGWEWLLPTRQAWAASFACCALPALAGAPRRVRWERPGRAVWVGLAAAALAAAGIGALLLGLGNGPRLLHEGALFHAGLAQALERGHPWEHPWLAGTPFPVPPAYPWLGRVVSVALGVPTTTALAGCAVLALATSCVSAQLAGAVVWRSAAAGAWVVPLACLAGNALGGWSPTAAGVRSGWLDELARGAPGTEPGELLYGLALFFRPAPAAPACAFALGAWTAAAHALRHGRGPWVGLVALLTVAAGLLHPWIGLATWTSILLVALAHPGERAVRQRVSVALAFAALPVLASWRTFGSGADGALPEPARLARALLGQASLLALPAALALGDAWRRRADEGHERGRRTVLLLFVSAAVALGSLAFAAGAAGPDLIALLPFPLALLAAGGLLEVPPGAGRSRARRVFVLAAGAALAFGGLRASAHACAAHLRFASVEEPALERGRFLCPEFAPAERTRGDGLLSPTVVSTPAQIEDARAVRRRHLALAYEWLRAAARAAPGERPILVRAIGPPDPEGRDPDPATLYADLPLWVDRAGGLAFGHPRWRPRAEGVHGLYSLPQHWDPAFARELEQLGRPVWFLVEERDRELSQPRGPAAPFRGIDLRLERYGARRVHVVGTVAVYRLDPPPAASQGGTAAGR